MASKKNIIYLLAALLLLGACKKSEIPTYDTDYMAVRFPTSNEKDPSGWDENTQIFVRAFSFVGTKGTDSHDYSIPVFLIGPSSDKEYQIPYEIVVEETTAPDGAYKIKSATIPAGKQEGAIVVTLFNNELLGENEFVLVLKLKSSSELSTGPVEGLRAHLSWSNRIPTPPHEKLMQTYNALIDGTKEWNSVESTHFSPNALSAIVEGLQWFDWDDSVKHPTDYNGSRYENYKYLPRIEIITVGDLHKAYTLRVADYIADYNKRHPGAPLVHDAGELKGSPVKARIY